ncbi:hypothetical protein POM88_054698 [Heracleum sosnowskyi]|uniref:Ubiquitin-like protease family profile domain-containing protein n=1 Tax=Heracleum sosnowskyi TaxID=360622 RepID=A0AAD8LWC4_9APIA|nr:hypothetical protein POM88_054698 [Heracleum sosnowskyi]
MTPSYKGWTEEKLRERQAIELYYGKFGVGSILSPLRDVPATTREKSRKSVVDDNAQDWNDYDNYEQGQCDYVHDNDTEQHHFESSQKDEVEELRLRAQELIPAKAQFDKDLVEAKEKFGDNADLLSIENVMNEVFNRREENVLDMPKNEFCVQKENVREIAAKFELRTQDIEHLEIIEYLNSEQARIDMPDLFDNIFSEDIEKVQTTDKDMQDDDDYITPKPEVRERSTRILKVGRYGKSPYIERVIDMSAKYTNQDLEMWLYMIRKNNILNNIFSWNGLTCIIEHLQTLKMKTCLFYFVIDTWSIILNDNENYKADESPMRLFCPIGSLYSGLNVDLSKTATYQYFAQNMDWALKKYKRKLENVDMVFFPINKYGHFYVICYNLKKEACDLIDNIKRECDPKQYYDKTPNTLRSQDNQICRLRVKYNNAILSSNLNEKKDGVVIEAKQLSNEATQKKLMNFIAQTSASRNKGSNMTSNSAKKKTVTFATNLVRNFDEAES